MPIKHIFQCLPEMFGSVPSLLARADTWKQSSMELIHHLNIYSKVQHYNTCTLYMCCIMLYAVYCCMSCAIGIASLYCILCIGACILPWALQLYVVCCRIFCAMGTAAYIVYCVLLHVLWHGYSALCCVLPNVLCHEHCYLMLYAVYCCFMLYAMYCHISCIMGTAALCCLLCTVCKFEEKLGAVNYQ